MQTYTFTVVDIFSILTIIGQFCAFLLVILFFFRESKLHRWISQYGLLLMLIVAVLATGGSLFFSEIAEWVPCKDCWLQRIFMYPQVLLLALALWKKDRGIALYILALCLIGAGIAIDHYADQAMAALFPIPDAEGVNMLLKPCDASGVSCAKTEIRFAYGYITLPMMALTAFILNGLGSLFLLRTKKA
jgi:disulfide bond formation protein DsbB